MTDREIAEIERECEELAKLTKIIATAKVFYGAGVAVFNVEEHPDGFMMVSVLNDKLVDVVTMRGDDESCEWAIAELKAMVNDYATKATANGDRAFIALETFPDAK